MARCPESEICRRYLEVVEYSIRPAERQAIDVVVVVEVPPFRSSLILVVGMDERHRQEEGTVVRGRSYIDAGLRTLSDHPGK